MKHRGKNSSKSDAPIDSDSQNLVDIEEKPKYGFLSGRMGLAPYYRQGMEYAYEKSSNAFKAFADPITTCVRTYNIAEPLIGHKRLLLTLGMEVALLTLLNAGIRYSMIRGGASKSTLDSMQSSAYGVEMPDIYDHAARMAWYGLGAAILYAGTEIVTRAGEMSLKYPILDQRLDRYYKDTNKDDQPVYLSMSSYPKASTIIPSDQKNLGSAVRLANTIFVSSAATIINGIYAVSSLYHISSTKEEGLISLNNILGTKLLFAIGATLVSNYLSQQYYNLKQEVQPLQTSLKEIESGNSINTKQIAQMNAGEFSSNQTLSVVNKVRIKEAAMTFWETTLKTWDKVITNVEPALDYLLSLKRAHMLRIGDKTEIARNLLDMSNVSKLFNFATTNNTPITELKSVLNSLESYEEIRSKAEKEKSSFLRLADRKDNAIHIEPGLEISAEDGNKRFFRLKEELVLPLKAGDEKLNAEDREGSRILVHGASGIGKSILLKALANIKTPGASLTGTFRFPEYFDKTKEGYDSKSPDICTIPQQFYFPARTSFLDMIKFPRINDKEMERNNTMLSFAGVLNQVGSLYPEQLIERQKKYNPAEQEKENARVLEIARDIVEYLGYSDRFAPFFENPQKEHPRWDNLSGGEQKVIPLIIAILEQPKILILDETWVGLDQPRVEKVHQLLNKYLPKTSIISVAHHEEAIDIRKEGCFYTHEFKLDQFNALQPEISTNTPTRGVGRNYSTYFRDKTPSRIINRDDSFVIGSIDWERQGKVSSLTSQNTSFSPFRGISNEVEEMKRQEKTSLATKIMNSHAPISSNLTHGEKIIKEREKFPDGRVRSNSFPG